MEVRDDGRSRGAELSYFERLIRTVINTLPY